MHTKFHKPAYVKYLYHTFKVYFLPIYFAHSSMLHPSGTSSINYRTIHSKIFTLTLS